MMFRIFACSLVLVCSGLGTSEIGNWASASAHEQKQAKKTKQRSAKQKREPPLQFNSQSDDRLPAYRYGSRFPAEYGDLPAWAARAFSRHQENEIWDRD